MRRLAGPFSPRNPKQPRRTVLPSLTYSLLYLPKLQLDRSSATEDRHHHFQRLAIVINLVDYPLEGRKWAFADAYRFVLLELDLELRLLFGVGNAVNNVLNLVLAQRSWIVGGADEPGHPWRGFHHVPDMIALSAAAKARQVHLDQNVSGKEHALAGVLLAGAHFGHRLGRNQNLANLVL